MASLLYKVGACSRRGKAREVRSCAALCVPVRRRLLLFDKVKRFKSSGIQTCSREALPLHRIHSAAPQVEAIAVSMVAEGRGGSVQADSSVSSESDGLNDGIDIDERERYLNQSTVEGQDVDLSIAFVNINDRIADKT